MGSKTVKHVDFETPHWQELQAGPVTWPGYASRILALEPEAYWRGVAADGTATDLSGHSHNGLGQDDVTPIEGVVRRDASLAMQCDGTGVGVTVPAHPSLSGFTDFTLMLWLRLAELDQPAAWFAGVFDGTNEDRSWLLRLDSQSRFGMLLSNDGQTNANMLFDEVSLTADQWHHAAIRRADDTVTCHLDGELIQTRSHTGALKASGADLHLGRTTAVDLAEVAVFRAAVSDAAIKSCYRAGHAFDLPT